MTALTDAAPAQPLPERASISALITGILALTLMILLPIIGNASEVTYRVTGVASNDVLNVRDRPGVPGSRIIGMLPPGERGVVWDGQSRRVADGGTWWRVLHPRVPHGGWVNARFLTEEAGHPAPGIPEDPDNPFMDHTAHERPYRVVGVASNDVLNIRVGPGVSYRIVGGFAPHGRDIWVTGRGRTLPSGAYWVEVILDRAAGRTGWVNSRFLTPQ